MRRLSERRTTSDTSGKEHVMTQHGAFIEIVERTKTPLKPGDLLVPTEVRINGQKLYTQAHTPIVVDRIVVGEEAVSVTLTLLAHRVLIQDEPLDVQDTPVVAG